MEEKQVKDLTKWNILKQIWQLSWPMMTVVFFYTLYNLVDTFWVSKVWDDAIAAVGISQITQMIMMTLSMGISVGSSVVMSMKIGAGDKKEASRVLAQGFVLATLLGIFFTFIALYFREWLLVNSGATWSIYEPALGYFTIISAGSLLLFYLINIMMAFNAEGDTFTLIKLFAISTVINVVLDPIVIFGKFGFPALGIDGAAYATLISQTIFILLAMRVLMKKNRSVRFSFSNLSMKWQSVKQVFDIGIPASLTQVINPIGLALLLSIISTKFLEPWATAFSLIYRFEFFAYLPAIGFGMWAMAMIWQNMWAWNFDRAQEVFKKASLLGFGSAIWIGLLLLLWGRTIVGIFTENPEVIQYSLWYLWIVAGSYGFMAVSMIVSSSFQAVWKSWPGFWLIFIKFFIFVVPVSYFITQYYDLAIWSLWYVILGSNIFVAVIWYIWKQKHFNKITGNIEA